MQELPPRIFHIAQPSFVVHADLHKLRVNRKRVDSQEYSVDLLKALRN
jgi:hypothetical protein